MYNGDLILASVPSLSKSDLLKGVLQTKEHYRVVLSWTMTCLEVSISLRTASVYVAVDPHAPCGLL